MSAAAVDKALAHCRAAAVGVAWRQWSVFGGQAGGRYALPKAVVDPEALLLLSCALRDDEQRLWDVAAGLAAAGSTLLSLQRTKNVAAKFPASVQAVLAEIATIAVEQGKDARWRPLSTGTHREFRSGKVAPSTRSGSEPGALLARLRLAFGVHVRSDALAFLIASAPIAATAREIADATCYGEMPVRRALDAIAESRLIATDGGRPARYHVEPARWAPLLQTSTAVPSSTGFPPWRHWHEMFAFLADAVPSARFPVGSQSDYLLSSEARQLVLTHRAAFVRNRVPIPEPADFPGVAFLAGFAETLSAVATWLGDNT